MLSPQNSPYRRVVRRKPVPQLRLESLSSSRNASSTCVSTSSDNQETASVPADWRRRLESTHDQEKRFALYIPPELEGGAVEAWVRQSSVLHFFYPMHKENQGDVQTSGNETPALPPSKPTTRPKRRPASDIVQRRQSYAEAYRPPTPPLRGSKRKRRSAQAHPTPSMLSVLTMPGTEPMHVSHGGTYHEWVLTRAVPVQPAVTGRLECPKYGTPTLGWSTTAQVDSLYSSDQWSRTSVWQRLAPRTRITRTGSTRCPQCHCNCQVGSAGSNASSLAHRIRRKLPRFLRRMHPMRPTELS
ncbi:hypothetical protein OBBRIDRAFT_790811 [Obba rivulosa]|uniref:Uncharacterized protein n=1 Tax=Obba rivulosa TaxID=1052685 RepID=A0A8E2DML7_9APHY|nr:hypothetical protein OBBRIDRAFT_790811 [Obba rivulosa]